MDLSGQNFLVAGLGKSGISACRVLSCLGAGVYVSDSGNAEKAIKEYSLNVKDYEGNGNTSKFLSLCDHLIVSPGISPQIPLIQEAIKANIPVQNELDFACGFFDFPLIGITGTNGKTTTTTLINEIILASDKKSFAGGNIGIPAIEMIGKVFDWGVLEISSYMLESCIYFKPKIAVVLNLTEDHLSRHGTMKNYLKVKLSIAKNQNRSDNLILNYDDVFLTKISSNDFNSNIWWFSKERKVEKGAFVRDNSIFFTDGSRENFVMKCDEIKIPGIHNLENALSACVAGVLAGVDLKIIKKVLMEFSGVEHRLETVKTIGGVEFINDSKGTNPDASVKGILAMKKPIILIAGGYDKKISLTPFVDAIDNHTKSAVLIGEVKNQIFNELKNKNSAFVEETLESAVIKAFEIANEGDCVLFSPGCASYDMFDNFEQRGKIFKEIVNRLK